MKGNIDEKFLTTTEVAEIFRLNRATVNRWAGSGRLKAVRIGNEYRFREDYIRSLLGLEEK